jgi:Holliday junction resolvase
MNASEIRYIEAQLRAEPRLPLAEDQYAQLIEHAKRERAKAIAQMWHSVATRVAAFMREVRDLAGSSNHGRVRRTYY